MPPTTRCWPGGGVNTLDGGAGVDTALYIGSRAGYAVTYTSTGVLTSSSLKGNSTDTGVRIEKASFSEGTLFVQAASDAGLDIAAFYQGLLFRPIDANGYRYWTDTAAQGTSAQSIGSAFLPADAASVGRCRRRGLLDAAAVERGGDPDWHGDRDRAFSGIRRDPARRHVHGHQRSRQSLGVISRATTCFGTTGDQPAARERP